MSILRIQRFFHGRKWLAIGASLAILGAGPFGLVDESGRGEFRFAIGAWKVMVNEMGRFPFASWTVAAVVFVTASATAEERKSVGTRSTVARQPHGTSNQDAPPGRVIYNLDETEFFFGTFGPVVPETIDKIVDDLAALGVTDLFVNVNAKRTNYRSGVWEAYWDGYDPEAGDDQPFFAGLGPNQSRDVMLVKNTLSIHRKGCDYPKRMLDRARQKHVKAWISLRMNDDHNPGLPDHPGHSTIWKSHPKWRLAYGLDYEQPRVREHYMKLIGEVCTRYDLDGLELDFLRFWLYFRDGRQHVGAKLMTEFVEQARTFTRSAEMRLGHPVELAVRVPTTPWIARMHGLDAVAWAKAGLVDLIIVSPFYPSIDSDVPVETWKGRLIGTNVSVALSTESGMNAGSGNRMVTHEELRGLLVSGRYRGADAVYFFNMFVSPYHNWDRKDHDQLLEDAGSHAVLCAGPRRHVVSTSRPWAVGEPGKANDLPITSTYSAFRIPIGPKPTSNRKTRIELVLPDHDQPLDVRLNGIPCPWSGLTEPKHLRAAGWTGPVPRRQTYDVPHDAISDGYNLVEVRAKEHVKITWAEISIR